MGLEQNCSTISIIANCTAEVKKNTKNEDLALMPA
jgi:hypothetical protein